MARTRRHFGHLIVILRGYFWLLFFVMAHEGHSVIIQRCHSGRVAVVEGESTSITCSEINVNRNVFWKYKLPSGQLTYIANCKSNNNCDSYIGGDDFSVTRRGAISSLVVRQNEQKYDGLAVFCQQDNFDENHNCRLWVIRRPGEPNVSSCEKYVPENTNVLCPCKASPPGIPPARVKWEGYNNESSLVLHNVHRGDNGRRFTCRLYWGYERAAVFQLHVAYGPDAVVISQSSLSVENGLMFTNLTCNASSYFPDVLYVWSISCDTEILVDKASVCYTSSKDQETNVTCTAVNSLFNTLNITTTRRVHKTASSEHSRNTLLTKALVGGILSMLGFICLTAGLIVYLKRRKEIKAASTVTYQDNETYGPFLEESLGGLSKSHQFSNDEGSKYNEDSKTQNAFRKSESINAKDDVCFSSTKECNDTHLDIYATPDKTTKSKQNQGSDSRPSAKNPVEMPVIDDDGDVTPNFGESESFYENLAAQSIKRITDSTHSRKLTPSQKPKKEDKPQPENDDTLYNRLSFSQEVHSFPPATPSESVYNHLDEV